MIREKNIRLFIPNKLVSGMHLELSPAHSHYLLNVMRVSSKRQARIAVFNREYGEFSAIIADDVHKKKKNGNLSIVIGEILRKPYSSDFSDKEQLGEDESINTAINLVFPAIKIDKLHFMLEKATEIGVDAIYYCVTDFSNFREFSANKLEKLKSIIIEAVEQCERLGPPRFYLAQKNSLIQLLRHKSFGVEKPLPLKSYNSDNLNFLDAFSHYKLDDFDFSCDLSDILPALLWNKSLLEVAQKNSLPRNLNLFCHPYILNLAEGKEEKKEKQQIKAISSYDTSEIFKKNLTSLKKLLAKQRWRNINIFVGPEGGFSSREEALFSYYYQNNQNLLRNFLDYSDTDKNFASAMQGGNIANLYCLRPLLLNSRDVILRAETAALAALTMVHTCLFTCNDDDDFMAA